MEDNHCYSTVLLCASTCNVTHVICVPGSLSLFFVRSKYLGSLGMKLSHVLNPELSRTLLHSNTSVSVEPPNVPHPLLFHFLHHLRVLRM